MLLVLSYAQQPTPHGVAGYIFDRLGVEQVPVGTPFRVNDSATNEIQRSTTGAGPFSGRWSMVIEGNDGDFIVVESWNATSYGRRNVTLLGDMDNVNFNLLYTRGPEVNLSIIFPPNGTMINVSRSFNLSYNTTIIGPGDATNCQARISWLNVTKANFTFNQTNDFGLGDLNFGSTTRASWNLSATHVGNVTFTVYTACSSDTSNLEHEDQRKGYVIFGDIDGPIISLISPANNSLNTTTSTINFYFSAQDASPSACTLVINGKANQTNYTILESTITRFTAKLLFGNNIWSVNCTDEAGNKGNSTNFSIEISIPEFTILSQNISFFPPFPGDNASVTANATIFNSGSSAPGTLVEVWQNDSIIRSIRNISIDFFQANSSYTVNATLFAHLGMNNIFFVVDANNTFSESDETDNYANNSFFVGTWQIYYGNASGRLEIANLLNLTILNWQTGVRNLFIVETGSFIGWADLFPISRDTSNLSRLEDFTQVDDSIGTTNFTDSVNNTFTRSGRLISNYSFTIYNQTITNVPTINTTITNSFITGILWDSSDGGTTYDASQDLVFATIINTSRIGNYGTYDYELRVPGALKNYLYPSYNTLTFYIELN